MIEKFPEVESKKMNKRFVEWQIEKHRTNSLYKNYLI